jgi:hypothetical protein
MPIEFRCNQCGQLLRVPDNSAGKSARCPKCQSLMTVPGEAVAIAPLASSAVGAPASSSFGEQPLAAGGGAGGGGIPPSPPANPFGDLAGNPYGDAAATGLNPYASPSASVFSTAPMPMGTVPIQPRPVPADAVFNYAWEVWKRNLGLLIGVTVTVGLINYAVALPFSGMQAVFQRNQDAQSAVAVALFGQLVNYLVQCYLGIGQVHIALKLARWQRAQFSDLFGGMPQFLPVLGGMIIATIVGGLGFLLLIVPGVLLALTFWPFYYLLVDRRAGVIESFSVARTITAGNWGTSFVLWLMTFGVMLVGCAALCVGLIAAMPLVSVMWATAYLMMSGQIPTHPMQAEQMTYQ